ncbi:MAG: winged helix domain-containing protein [Marinosulfonomonas sp.]
MHIHVTIPGGERPRTFELKGRLGWTVLQLAQAGAHGVTSIERPAPRWSAYVHDLRRRGIPIETEMVAHGGAYCGHHARYRLTCDVALVQLDGGTAE